MNLSGGNAPVAAKDKYRSEAQAINRLLVDHLSRDYTLEAGSAYFNAKLPERHRVTRATIYNWLGSYTHMNEGMLMSLKAFYPPDDPRHLLALTIEEMRNTVRAERSRSAKAEGD